MAEKISPHLSTKNILDTPIEYLKSVGPSRADILKKELQIFTFGDLLEYYPFKHIDKTQMYNIADITTDTASAIQLQGTITRLEVIAEGTPAKRMVAYLTDHTGTIELLWFRQILQIKKWLQPNKTYTVFGKPNFFKTKPSLTHPEIEPVENETDTLTQPQNLKLQAAYNTTAKLTAIGLASRGVAKLLQLLWDKIKPTDLPEFLPEHILQSFNLCNRYLAYQNIHFPTTETLLQKAQHRLKFEELFVMQLRLLYQKNQKNAIPNSGFVFANIGENFNTFYTQKLPFELTNAQKRVIKEIRRDTLQGKQMNRLVQGDVGSGKTIVALMTMLVAIDNSFQTCLMAPTEILAQQHFDNIQKMLNGLNVNIQLLTASVKGKKRKQLLESLQLGIIHILVGTHALIEDTVVFPNLGMVVIDEQHRFGVAQRAKLWAKNQLPPHVLVMTATPIPRTLAMTIYGDLDVSVIDELPPGRKPIKTFHYFENKRLALMGFMRAQIEEGRQVYIVYPLIEESETLNYKNLMDGYEAISRTFPLPEYKISVVHGQLSTIDKEAEMQRFKNHETQIMIATTVIEVGVDVPNATVMIIESAEKFGLAQLHQLRGRVGRGGAQSYCILMTGNNLSADGRLRMKTMVDTTDGFKIADVDLQLRGPGNIEGTQQSGLLNLKLANLTTDGELLRKARQAATDLLQDDSNLAEPQHQALKNYILNQNNETKSKWSKIS